MPHRPASSCATYMPARFRRKVAAHRDVDRRLADCRYLLLLSRRSRHFGERTLRQVHGGAYCVTGVVGKVAHRQFLSFLITGGIAALVNLATRIAFNFAMPFEIAVIMAYLCGM